MADHPQESGKGDPTLEDNSSPPTLAALNWARALQLFQKHGITGIIVVLLAYQLGWLANAQSQVCA